MRIPKDVRKAAQHIVRRETKIGMGGCRVKTAADFEADRILTAWAAKLICKELERRRGRKWERRQQ